MIKIELDESKCFACETDVSKFEEPYAVEDAALEIKTAMFLVMADEFIKLTKKTGQRPYEVVETMIDMMNV